MVMTPHPADLTATDAVIDLNCVAIVNRGEPAMRLLRAVREYNLSRGTAIETVALLTAPDRDSAVAHAADRVIELRQPPSRPASDAYLDVDGVMAALDLGGADAVWVGWGFLAESAELSRRVRESGRVFIGPPPEAMRVAGDKIGAKRLAESAGVPVVPWSGDVVASVGEARGWAERLGYPVALKAAAGGGGRGIRMAMGPDDLDEAYASASLEAERAFGDPRLFVERCIDHARHLEVQIAADSHGRVLAYGVRDCTVQRRHQKLLEESPGPLTTPALRATLEGHAISFAAAAGYENVGTVEFLYDLSRDECWFMEMNARLQVEHTVTEEVFGVDLVKLQLDLARGLPLPERAPSPRGYAIEARLNAEDSERDDTPAPGRLLRFTAPQGPGVRVDAGVREGGSISPDFDSMVAKVIAHGRDRADAIARLRGALDDLQVLIEDGATNKGLLVNALAHPDFVAGDFDTAWLDRIRRVAGLTVLDTTAEALLVAAVLSYEAERDRITGEFYRAVERGVPQKLPAAEGGRYRLGVRGHRYESEVYQLGPGRFRVYLDGVPTDLGLEQLGRGSARLLLDELRLRVLYHAGERAIFVEVEGIGLRIERDSGGTIYSPTPAMVIALDVGVGDLVSAGDRVATLESMKMEMALRSPESGRVTALHTHANASVGKGDPLISLEPEDLGAERDDALKVSAPATADPFAALFDAEGAPQPSAVRGVDPERLEEVHTVLVAELRRALLGYDLDPARATLLERLLASSALWDAPLFSADPAALVNTFCGFADVEWALSSRQLRGVEGRPCVTMGSAFYLFARGVDRGEDAARDDYRAHLLRALAAYGVHALTPSPELRAALVHMAVTQRRSGPLPSLRFSLVMSLIQLLSRLAAEGHISSGDRRLERALLQLRAFDDRAWLTLADHAAGAHHQIFQQPRFEQRASAVRVFIDDVLERASGAEDPRSRAAAIDALIDASVVVTRPLAQALCLRRGPGRSAAGEAFFARLYNDRELEGLTSEEREGRLVVRGRSRAPGSLSPVGHALITITTSDLPHTISQIARELEGLEPHERPALVDLVTWADELDGAAFDLTAARFEAAVSLAPEWPAEIQRLTLIVASQGHSLRAHTLSRPDPPAGPWRASDELRGLHPVAARHLEIWRLERFALERLPSHDGIYVFRGAALAHPDDSRIFVLGEVRDVHEAAPLEPAPASLPSFEHALREAVQALRQVQSERPGAGARYHWNQIALQVRPAVSLRRDHILDLVGIMPVDFRALGIDRVVIRGRLADPTSPDPAPAPVEVTITNPSGHQLEIRIDAPSAAPIAEASDYELKVRRTRRFNVSYPYEVIRLLTGAGPETDTLRRHRFPPGEFTEYDLRDSGGGLDDSLAAAPVQRPPGNNSAAIVFGLIRHQTAKHPEGMERVLLLSDPLKGLGALAEPECRRVIAALDLAERRGVPIEWVPISSGARISMDTGTENLDWTALVLRRIIEFTEAGGAIHIIVDGVNVGAQSYFNAEATMLMHTRGALIMTPRGSMVLTGKRALDFSGGVSAADERGIGGYERIMGPNGQAQYYAEDLADAFAILLEHYRYTYIAPGEARVRPLPTADPPSRDPMTAPYPRPHAESFERLGEIFSAETNRERKRPFDMRAVMAAVIDADGGHLERFADMSRADTAIIWDAHLGGHAVCLIGFESRPLPRHGDTPGDGPDTWSAGTLFPRSSKKVARAIHSASGNRPLVLLANLSGFDGSPESMRDLQLEYGAEIGRAVVGFRGPILFYVIGRYHGGAYVVFSKALNPSLEAVALEGSYASVIGGAPAAAVVLSREVKRRTLADPRVVAARDAVEAAAPAERRARRVAYDAHYAEVHAEKLGELAREFDAIHSVYRARDVGSLDEVIAARDLRRDLCGRLERAAAELSEAPPPRGAQARRR